MVTRPVLSVIAILAALVICACNAPELAEPRAVDDPHATMPPFRAPLEPDQEMTPPLPHVPVVEGALPPIPHVPVVEGSVAPIPRVPSSETASPFFASRADPYPETSAIDGHEPLLRDPEGDVPAGDLAAVDLIAAYALITSDWLLLRIETAQPLTPRQRADIRLWLHQDDVLVTVELKPDHRDLVCEVIPPGEHDGRIQRNCLRPGGSLDAALPLEALEDVLDVDRSFFITGVSTCCVDTDRAIPYDEIDGAVTIPRGEDGSAQQDD